MVDEKQSDKALYRNQTKKATPDTGRVLWIRGNDWP